MTVPYGLSAYGFRSKTLTQIREDLNEALRSAFGASIDLGDKSIFGQIVGIVAEILFRLWQQLEAVYASQDPNKATGASLDAVSSITGTQRPPASYSAVVMTLFGTPGSSMLSGRTFSTDSTGQQFVTTESVVIAAVAAWFASTAYVLGDRVLSDTNRIYECIVGGISHAVTAVSGTGSDIVDGTVHWKIIGDGITDGGAVDATARATVTGPTVALAGDITTIVDGAVGLQSVVNLAAAAPGRPVATDEELRVLREEELAADGQTPAEAIKAAVLKINGVTTCTVFENIFDTTDADGMPPHSVEVLVRTTWSAGDPQDQLIYDVVRKNIAAGIVSAGNTTGSSTDADGVSHVIKFSRPVNKLIYATLDIEVDASTFPVDGSDEIKNEIVTWGNAQAAGKDAVSSAISARAFRVDGVLDVTNCTIGLTPAPISTLTIPVSKRELAVFDVARLVTNITTSIP